MSNLYDKVCDYNTLKLAYKQTQLGSRKYRKEAINFDMSRERKLVELWRQLKCKSYSPGSYIEFYVYEPKARLIHAPHIRDKIVQFSVHTVLQEIYQPVFIRDSYACLKGRGTHEAVKSIQHYMRLAQRKYSTPYILKIDVTKYFYSINRDILKRLYRKKIHRKETDFLQLLDMIVDSSPEGDKGLPLGNVTSQDFANIYLNEVDQYCKRYLGLKWYVRYMDDITIILPDKDTAKEVLSKVSNYITNYLDLELNGKTQIYPLNQGINTLGFKIHTTHKLVRDNSKKAMKRRIKEMNRKLEAGLMTEKEIQIAVNAWLGHARHSNSYNLCKRIFKEYSYIKIESEKQKFGEKHLI